MNLKIGFVANPFAGIGGPAGLKGSDGADIVAEARRRGVESRVSERVLMCLSMLEACRDKIDIVTVPGPMGASICEAANWPTRVIESPQSNPSRAEDTQIAVKRLIAEGVDLLLFAGGDGTARDVFDVISNDQLVLGIPCGVKMHSGIFANNPASAAEILQRLTTGELVETRLAEVRDIDEAAFRRGRVQASYYGELWIPDAAQQVQRTKSGGAPVEAQILDDIAASVVDKFDDEICYFIGSGSTTAALMDYLGLDNTLLGVDVIRAGSLEKPDAFEAELYDISQNNDCKIIVTVIGGQGHLFGRGNQQLSPRVIRAVGSENIIVIATKEKLRALDNKLLLDTGDRSLDEALAGFIKVLTGYDETVLCRISA